MARWFYNRPSERCDLNEIKVANSLRRLGKRWTIRWGFYYLDNKGVRREGDFLIFDPLHGLLVLEVKGGRFRQFPPTGRWEGDPDKDPDHPLFQLDQEHAGVLKELTSVEPGWRPVAKALCLPNEFIPENQRTFQGLPRDILVDKKDLQQLDSIFGRFFSGKTPRNIQDHRKVFLRAYGKGGAPDDIKHFIDHNEIIFRKQVTRQYQLLDILEENRQLLIKGGAGTGKTWHAIEKSVRLAEQGEGAHVLFLCYNIALSRLLREILGRRQLEKGQITVFQWEELANHLLDCCGLENQTLLPDASREERQRYYDRDLPELLNECVREEAFSEMLPRFDALVVDEAQDHDTAFTHEEGSSSLADDCGWWSIYFALLREGTKAPIVLFYDKAQRPPFRGSGGFDVNLVARGLSQPAFARLPHALRYTQPIFDFLKTLNAPATEALIEQLPEPEDLPEGPDVISRDAAGHQPEAVLKAVESIATHWLEEGYCQPDDILLLHARTELRNSVLGPCDSLVGLPLVEYGQETGGEQKVVRHLSINRAKGLDSLAVIMIGVHPFQMIERSDEHYTYFMGASRAKQLLGIVHG